MDEVVDCDYCRSRRRQSKVVIRRIKDCHTRKMMWEVSCSDPMCVCAIRKFRQDAIQAWNKRHTERFHKRTARIKRCPCSNCGFKKSIVKRDRVEHDRKNLGYRYARCCRCGCCSPSHGGFMSDVNKEWNEFHEGMEQQGWWDERWKQKDESESAQ